MNLPWPNWQESGAAALLSLVAYLVVRRLRPSKVGDAMLPAFKEFALVSGLYAIWRIARELPFTHESGALARARDIDRFQQWLHVPTEISLQNFAVQHDSLARFVNAYYATVHVPALLTFLVWMFVRHRDRYPHWRNGLVAVTAGCLVVRFIRVAPPRFIPELHFVDLTQHFGLGVYGPVGTGISDQFAAMPSIHVGWAAVVALGVFFTTSSRWRWVIALHLPMTMYVVAATGNHWWLDGVAVIPLLWGGLLLDLLIQGRTGRRATAESVSRDAATGNRPG